MDRDSITRIIFSAVEETNQLLPTDQRIDQDTDVRLFGRESKLDSLGLVSLIASVEQKLADHTGSLVTLADERAMSQERSPFRSIGSLAEYIETLVG